MFSEPSKRANFLIEKQARKHAADASAELRSARLGETFPVSGRNQFDQLIDEYTDDWENSSSCCQGCTFANRGLSQAKGDGVFGRVKRLVTYEPTYLRELLWPVAVDLTVYSNYTFWLQAMIPYSVCVLFIALPIPPLSVGVQTAVDSLTASFNALLAFLLAGFVAMVVDIWKERREEYAQLIGASRGLLILFSSLIDVADGDSEEEARLTRSVRAKLGRYVLLAFELSTLKARHLMDKPAGKLHLEALGLLHEGEWAVMTTGERHTVVYGWMLHVCNRWMKRGKLAPPVLGQVNGAILETRRLSNDLMLSLSRDPPYPYASMVGLTTKLAIIWNAFQLGLSTKVEGETLDPGGLVLILLFVFLYFIVFQVPSEMPSPPLACPLRSPSLTVCVLPLFHRLPGDARPLQDAAQPLSAPARRRRARAQPRAAGRARALAAGGAPHAAAAECGRRL